MAEAVPWIVAGRYEVGEIVGRGGYGMVRRAIDLTTGQPVGMKLLSADAGRDPQLVERMLREQQAMVAMAGTCAVTAIDLCRLSSGAPCLVMEWLEGCDLERQLSDWEAEGHHPSITLVLELLRPLTGTLQRAHDLGIVHRDIKPANVFLTAGRTDAATANAAVRLLDFGLSRMRSSAPLTAIGMVMGSPSYIPPETWRGNSALIDHRADLYSLAVIVFRMLTGRLPFETPSLIEKLKLVTTSERPSVCAFRPDLPAVIDDWMKRALAVEPDQRFQTAREFYDALTLAVNGAPFSLAEEELSGVRQKTSLASVLPSESRNVLSVAWERATSLLSRFIGQKAAQSVQAADAPIVPAPIVPITPRAPEESEAAVAPESVIPPTDRPSFAWLDDNDVEDLPPESVQGTAPSAIPAKAPKKTRARATSPGGKKKQASAPTKKAQKPKATKSAKAAGGAKKAQLKKSKAARKKR